MFTGIVQAVGGVAEYERHGADARLRLDAGRLAREDVSPGDSIAVSGVCLTVVALTERGFEADVSAETLARTTLGGWRAGDRVNLEKAMMPSERIGGHFVSGHVDGIGTVVGRHHDGHSVRARIEAPAVLARYIAEKGSICVDGVSLTVNGVRGAEFDVNIVPHTQRATTLGDYRAGRRVNLEVDLIARYLERLLLGDRAAEPGALAAPGVTLELLTRQGFVK